MESWKNTNNRRDTYIQWVEYSLLANVHEMTSLRHECTLMADWLQVAANESIRVTLKNIVDEQNDQSFDFHKVNNANRIIYVCYIALN